MIGPWLSCKFNAIENFFFHEFSSVSRKIEKEEMGNGIEVKKKEIQEVKIRRLLLHLKKKGEIGNVSPVKRLR